MKFDLPAKKIDEITNDDVRIHEIKDEMPGGPILIKVEIPGKEFTFYVEYFDELHSATLKKLFPYLEDDRKELKKEFLMRFY
jgi:hypothetical protein